jgi:hypothetical protein
LRDLPPLGVSHYPQSRRHLSLSRFGYPQGSIWRMFSRIWRTWGVGIYSACLPQVCLSGCFGGPERLSRATLVAGFLVVQETLSV